MGGRGEGAGVGAVPGNSVLELDEVGVGLGGLAGGGEVDHVLAGRVWGAPHGGHGHGARGGGVGRDGGRRPRARSRHEGHLPRGCQGPAMP